MPPKGSRPGPVVQDPNKPAQKKRAPKLKAPTRKVRTKPVLKNTVFRSREKKLAVLTWIVQTRYPCTPLHQGRAGLVTEFGWRCPTDQEAADFFKIPATTINSWWRNRDEILNQPKGSRMTRQKQTKKEEGAVPQTEREASGESETSTPGLESSGVYAETAIDSNAETPAPEVPSEASKPPPSFLSTLNTVVNFCKEPPPPSQNTWRHKAKAKSVPEFTSTPPPLLTPFPIIRAPAPETSRPIPQSPAPQSSATAPVASRPVPQPSAPNLFTTPPDPQSFVTQSGPRPSVTPPDPARGDRAHINAVTSPPPRQATPVGPPPPHRTENIRVVYPEPPPAARIESIDPDLPRSRGPAIPPPVVLQYPAFPAF